MANEEAREAARKQVDPHGVMENAEELAFDMGFDAGVAEGIRQASVVDAEIVDRITSLIRDWPMPNSSRGFVETVLHARGIVLAEAEASRG